MELIAVHHGSWPKHTVWLARSKAKVVFAEHEKVKSSSYQCNPNEFEAHLQDKGGVEVIMKVQDIQKSQKCFADRNGDRTRRPIQRRCRGGLTKMDGEAPCEETSRRWMEKILAQQRTAAEKIQRR